MSNYGPRQSVFQPGCQLFNNENNEWAIVKRRSEITGRGTQLWVLKQSRLFSKQIFHNSMHPVFHKTNSHVVLKMDILEINTTTVFIMAFLYVQLKMNLRNIARNAMK